MIPVNRPQYGPKQPSNFNRHENKSNKNCYYYGAPNWTREHSKVCKARGSICRKCGKKGHLDSLCRSNGKPMHMLEAQDYSHPQFRTQEPPQDYNQIPETVQYSTPYFISKEELPQVKCNSLKTVQSSRLCANEQSEHIRTAWIAQSQNSKVYQVDIEIYTGAGCTVMPLYKVNELFGQE